MMNEFGGWTYVEEQGKGRPVDNSIRQYKPNSNKVISFDINKQQYSTLFVPEARKALRTKDVAYIIVFGRALINEGYYVSERKPAGYNDSPESGPFAYRWYFDVLIYSTVSGEVIAKKVFTGESPANTQYEFRDSIGQKPDIKEITQWIRENLPEVSNPDRTAA
jgi:hypothetical protein